MNIKVDILSLPTNIICPFCGQVFELENDFIIYGSCPHFVETGGGCDGSMWAEFDDGDDYTLEQLKKALHKEK